MSDEQMAAIAARLAAITPGPWQWARASFDRHHVLKAGDKEMLSNTLPGYVNVFVSLSVPGADAAFIAAAPDDVAYLLDRAQVLQSENTALRLDLAVLASAVKASNWVRAADIVRDLELAAPRDHSQEPP